MTPILLFLNNSLTSQKMKLLLQSWFNTNGVSKIAYILLPRALFGNVVSFHPELLDNDMLEQFNTARHEIFQIDE